VGRCWSSLLVVSLRTDAAALGFGIWDLGGLVRASVGSPIPSLLIVSSRSVRTFKGLSCLFIRDSTPSIPVSHTFVLLVILPLFLAYALVLCVLLVTDAFMGGICNCGLCPSLPWFSTVGKPRLVVVAVQGAPEIVLLIK
jgi:hypothetical protein